jgi:hypothetical protein
MKIGRLLIEDIKVGSRLRPIHEAAVAMLVESMQRLGQLSPISVFSPDGSPQCSLTLWRIRGPGRLAKSAYPSVVDD